MFSYQNRPKASIYSYVNQYLEHPVWDHAFQIVPMLAWLSREPNTWLDYLSTGVIPSGATQHIVRSLRSWSAFRGPRSLQDKQAALTKHLPGFVAGLSAEIQKIGKTRLTDLEVKELEELCRFSEQHFNAFGRQIKGTDSLVLPSKTAHLIFPSIFPAYDREIIQLEVLDHMVPARMRGRLNYRTYLRLSHWVLKELQAEGKLEQANQTVLNALRRDWAIDMLAPGFPTDASLSLIDTITSEYALIALAEDGVNITFESEPRAVLA